MSEAPTPDDGDLARRVLAGETRLYAELVRRHQDAVFRVAAAMVGDAESADNAVQQAFVNAFEHLDQFRPDHPFGHWIKAIARNVIRQQALRTDREQRRLSLYRDFVEVATAPTQERLAEELGMDAALRACREALAPTAEQALGLRYERGCSIEEVAAAMGRSAAATRQLLFRARIALRDCVERRLASA